MPDPNLTTYFPNKDNPAGFTETPPGEMPIGVRNWPLARAVARRKAEEARLKAKEADELATKAEAEAEKTGAPEGEEEALANPTVNPQPLDPNAPRPFNEVT